jgi:DNA-binding CsgD family transcriptional regulator
MKEQAITEARHGSKVSFSWRSLCHVAAFATIMAWHLLVTISPLRLGIFKYRDGYLFGEYLSLIMIVGLCLAFVYASLRPIAAKRMINRVSWLVVLTVGGTFLNVTILLYDESSLAWLIVASCCRLVVGFCSAFVVLLLARYLSSSGSRSSILLSTMGSVTAILIYVIVNNLVAAAAFSVLCALPVVFLPFGVAALKWHLKTDVAADDGSAQASEKEYVKLRLFSNNGIDGRRTRDDGVTFNTGLHEKAMGLFTYGFSTGAATGICVTAIGQSTTEWVLLSTVFMLEIIVAGIALVIPLRIVFERSYLRLPQWSFYFIAIVAFLMVALVPLGYMRMVFSGLVVSAAVYFFTVDLNIISRMAQDMKQDSIHFFGLYESIFFGSILIGWGLFCIFFEVGGHGSEFAFTALPMIVIATVALMMALMRWIFFNSFLKREGTTRTGEWRKRCLCMGKKHGFTKREIEIFILLARGRSVNHISDHLVVSTSTVKTHVNNIYRKLGIHSRQELIDLFEKSYSE